jgi:transcriptional regulator with XRE-family HTH domain
MTNESRETDGELSSLIKVAHYIEQIRNGDLPEEMHRALLGAVVSDFRISKGLNRAELAEIAEVPRAIITKIEHGKLKPSEIDNLWLAGIGGALEIPGYLLVYLLRGLPKVSARGIAKTAEIRSEQNVTPEPSGERAKPRYRPGLAF